MQMMIQAVDRMTMTKSIYPDGQLRPRSSCLPVSGKEADSDSVEHGGGAMGAKALSPKPRRLCSLCAILSDRTISTSVSTENFKLSLPHSVGSQAGCWVVKGGALSTAVNKNDPTEHLPRGRGKS
jgi:hypothetical protein